MILRRNFTIATIVVTVAGLGAAVSVRAGGDKVAFPQSYGKGVVYMTLDRPRTSRSGNISRARRRSTPRRRARRFRTAR